ncbi:hypothetical protein [Aquibacillus rhizosphaerae]|uniref:Uncharacterized protein n=1 Tax=Aquibacillus rhizosphaerae TaxID=3051431 RepID=A0ABT7L785_9BACI|nr:hypothetical protein [Aquibacillus sp. LR5S19]MDL4841724.1 hypothetical protein [Aquibacillus sp. LR5S19]
MFFNGYGITEHTETVNNETEKEYHEDFVSVQDYNGEGYDLKNGEETDRIAEANRDQVEEAVIKFFIEKYKKDNYEKLLHMW